MADAGAGADDSHGIIDYAVHYPFQRGWTHLVKGGTLALLGILILPLFMLYGYALRVIAAAAAAEELPPIRDFWNLFVEGIVFFVVLLPYMLAISSSIIPFMIGGESMAALAVSGVIQLLAVYIGPILVATYATTRDWRQVYTLGTVRRAFTGVYLSRFILFVFLYIMIYIVLILITLISFITIIGPVIVLFLGTFYMTVALAAYIGRMYSDVRGNA